MLRRVLWRRRRARRRERSFSRAGESLFAGYRFELGESIFESHLYSPTVGVQFQNECAKKNPSTQRTRSTERAHGRSEKIENGIHISQNSRLKTRNSRLKNSQPFNCDSTVRPRDARWEAG